MNWQYNTYIKWKQKDFKLSYSVSGRRAIYKFQGVKYSLEVNPLTVYDDILLHITDTFIKEAY